jgi:hypothetical protein
MGMFARQAAEVSAMIAFPWFLLAVGIILVIVGFFVLVLSAASRPKRPAIDHRMRDDEIVRHLREEQRITFPGWVILAGMGCVLVSVVWRLALVILKYTAD